MRTIVVLGVTLLVALNSAAGDETKKSNADKLRIVCSLAKEGLIILPAEPELAAKDSTQLIITCDSMRLGSDGGMVVKNFTIEMKEGIFSGTELAIHFDFDGRSISFHSTGGGGIRDMRFVAKPKAEQAK